MLKISFTTVTEYLFLLRDITQHMSILGSASMFYLAAAVSDFYIPEQKMAHHKIQSSGAGLLLHLDPVPKIIQPLVKEWATRGFIVSFKLETDVNLLEPKSRMALERYGHQVVVANMLETRKMIVSLISPHDCEIVELSVEDEKKGVEIEKMIVEKLVVRHRKWIADVESKNII